MRTPKGHLKENAIRLTRGPDTHPLIMHTFMPVDPIHSIAPLSRLSL